MAKVEYCSQSLQDIFALTMATNQTYIEIGANDPRYNSNTFKLEMEYGWRGISIEFDERLKPNWENSDRKNKIYWGDAMSFDYAAALRENGLPTHINYFSCDIEPPQYTFIALQRVIEQGITFDCITFEHDLYACPNPNYDVLATEYLKTKGYKPFITNVIPLNPEYKPNDIFETWFVREDFPHTSMDFMDFAVRMDNLLGET